MAPTVPGRQLRGAACLSSKPISAAAAASRCFLGDSACQSHTRSSTCPPERQEPNSPAYPTVCRLTFCPLCVGLFGAGCGHTGYQLKPQRVLRKPDIHDPGSSGSSCGETFILSFVFYSFLFIALLSHIADFFCQSNSCCKKQSKLILLLVCLRMVIVLCFIRRNNKLVFVFSQE